MRVLISMLLLLCTTITYAQDGEFTVLSVKGAVLMDGKEISIGMKIGFDSKIKITKDGYLALLHPNGEIWESAKRGSYQASTIVKVLAAKDSSSREIIVIPGSICRYPPLAIKSFLPRKIPVFADLPCAISWEQNRFYKTSDFCGLLKVKLWNLYDEPLDSTLVSDTVYQFNVPKSQFNDENPALIIQVFDKKTERLRSDKFCLFPAPDSIKIRGFIQEQNLGSSAEDQLILAAYFEKKGLYLNAIACYKIAIRNSDSEKTLGLYEKFCNRKRKAFPME